MISESERNEYFAAKNQYPKQMQIEATWGDSASWELRNPIFTCCVAHSEPHSSHLQKKKSHLDQMVSIHITFLKSFGSPWFCDMALDSPKD